MKTFCQTLRMKSRAFGQLNLFLVSLVALGMASCATSPEQNDSKITKERGVYTTVAVAEGSLELPASGYNSCKLFSPAQSPAAVVTGYGYWDGGQNHPQPFNLQLVEADSGAVIQNFSGLALAGKATVVALPIRKSGKYRLKLYINNSVYDTWDFTVSRETPADVKRVPTTAPKYARGNFSAGIESETIDAFNEYDEYLLDALNNAVQKELNDAKLDDFAQTSPGQVVVRFELNASGQVSSPQILESSLSKTLEQFFIHALENGAPYKAWPAAARAALGADSRTWKVTFSYD
jgi:hypothetical protein